MPKLEELREKDLRNREDLLDVLDEAINQALYKITDGRLRNMPKEKLKIKYLKATGYLVNMARQLRKDSDLDELEQRLEELENNDE